MKNIFILFIFSILLISCKEEQKQEQAINEEITKMLKQETKKNITFPSKDGLTITADVYKVNNSPVTMLLCHQAGFSRGEYKDTALELNKLGYSVMAIDQRSGKIANDVVNETAKLAESKNLPVAYLDAKPDINAAVEYVYNMNGNKPMVLVGSSYSATLALLIAQGNEKIKAVASFSPGEYYKGMDIQESIKGLQKPTFVTASLSETEALATLVSKMKTDNLTHYKPIEKGIHGSRALWKTTEGTDGYWKAFKAFLSEI